MSELKKKKISDPYKIKEECRKTLIAAGKETRYKSLDMAWKQIEKGTTTSTIFHQVSSYKNIWEFKPFGPKNNYRIYFCKKESEVEVEYVPLVFDPQHKKIEMLKAKILNRQKQQCN